MSSADGQLDPRAVTGMRRQLEAWRGRLEAGAGRVGWKIGLNPSPVMERMGLTRPVVGHLTGLSRLEPGGPHSLTGGTNVAVEPEVLVEVGAYAEPSARPAIAGLGAALEVVDLDRPLEDLEEIVATNIFHRAVLPGATRAGTSLAGVQAEVRVNGDVRHRVDVAQAAMDLEEAVAVVADMLEACDERLEPGDLIIAGSLTEAIRVAAGDRVALDLGRLGRLELDLVE
jgi:2-oxo-3-hexenedioate decarboxylase